MDTETHPDPPDEHAEVKAAFRQWMQRLRKRMGLNQRDFARRFGIHYVTINCWEQGKYFPDSKHRRMLNIYARDVHLEPMPDLPQTVFGPPKGSHQRNPRKRKEEVTT